MLTSTINVTGSVMLCWHLSEMQREAAFSSA